VGSLVESMLVELSTDYSAAVVRAVAEILTAVIFVTGDYTFRMATALRVRPSHDRWE
jgi:hypothetical protein